MYSKTLIVLLLIFLSSHHVQAKHSFRRICAFEQPKFSSATLSAATVAAVLYLSFVTLPAKPQQSAASAIYTYYTVLTVLVSILAFNLVWLPMVSFLTDCNIVLSKTLLYMDRYLFGRKIVVLQKLGKMLRSKAAVIWSTNLIGFFFLFSATPEILHFIKNFITKVPISKFLKTIKKILAPKCINTATNMFNYENDIMNFTVFKRKNNRKPHYTAKHRCTCQSAKC